MNLQYISDSKGQTTGVFIPINEWNDLQRRYKGIEQEYSDIPACHQDLVRQRLESYQKNPDSAMDFDATMDEIEKNL